MSTIDLTLNNPTIRAYFSRTEGVKPPLSEFYYIASHPLVSPNFITEIEEKISAKEAEIMEKGLKSFPTHLLAELAEHATRMANALPLGDDPEVALQFLDSLREVLLILEPRFK